MTVKRTTKRAETALPRLSLRPKREKLPTSSMMTATAEDPYVRLQASGIVIMPGAARPVFLLKAEDSGEILPVWMHPLDASVGLHELGQGSEGSPHSVARLMLQKLNVKSVDCFFTERIGHHQYVRIELVSKTLGALGHGLGSFRVRADEVMSFCIANKARFFSTRSYIAQCRVLNEELEKLQEGLLTGAVNEAFPELEIGSKKSGYMM